jgi:ribosomal protein L11 methyltransferase
MEWTRVKVSTDAYGAEIVMGVLLQNDVSGMEIINPQERVRHLTEAAASWDYAEEGLLDVRGREVQVVFYVTKDSQGDKMFAEIEKALVRIKDEFALDALEIKTESADDSEWLDEWKKHFKPFSIGKIKIVPEWEKYTNAERDEIVFRIDPGSAFGTGQHQTTQLCISALQKYLREGGKLLDIGCGSGILSIIGLLLGADEVLACDIDPAGAVAATKNNAKLNKIDINRLKIYSGDVLSDEGLRGKIYNKYQVIAANIVADVIIGLLPFVKENLDDGGVFISSGIIDERAEEVRSAFAEQGYKTIEELQSEGWHCIIAGA